MILVRVPDLDAVRWGVPYVDIINTATMSVRDR